MAKLKYGDQVRILAGDERGSYGVVVVVVVQDDEYHVALHTVDPTLRTSDVRVYGRGELRKPRSPIFP